MDQKDTDFMKVFVGVIVGLVVFMIVIIIAANAISGRKSTDVSSDPMVQAAIEKRIKPIGEVNTAAVKQAAASTGGSAVDGKSVFQSACSACHGTGVAGAPKFGDKGAWGDRIAKGMSTLFNHALNGFKGMPARGGRGDLSDDAVKAAVKYMVENSK